MSAGPWRPEEGIGSSEAEVIGSYEPQNMGTGNSTENLCKKNMFLPTEPSLKPLAPLLIWILRVQKMSSLQLLS